MKIIFFILIHLFKLILTRLTVIELQRYNSKK